ncbi:hypothetical protein EDD30_4634 [Couchioplanes caeruleus]|uniref:Flagellar biosynthesis protein FlhF n=2 Tax=Couchioplanes caeruleus TaxID=56438 RepID=A0A1K0GL03_9ACTN|nr:hypothetical protein BG844_35260 [Couchioplanes caeruleus subsp. caeruleus]ROP31711.1 hypothetical protein EDD30_4634 [Couchioplanes caeruleus]
MPTRVLLEGPAIEPLLAQVRDEYGSSVRIISADKVRTGGFGGFFAKQHYELSVEVPDPGERTDAPPRRAPAASDEGPQTLEQLLARAESRDRIAPGGPPGDRTAGRDAGFGDVDAVVGGRGPGLDAPPNRGLSDPGSAFAELMANLDKAEAYNRPSIPPREAEPEQPESPAVRPFRPAQATGSPVNGGANAGVKPLPTVPSLAELMGGLGVNDHPPFTPSPAANLAAQNPAPPRTPAAAYGLAPTSPAPAPVSLAESLGGLGLGPTSSVPATTAHVTTAMPTPVRPQHFDTVQQNLMRVGMPEEMAAEITGGDTYAGVLGVLAARPSAPAVPDAPGEILVLAGDLDHAVPMGRKLCEQAGLDQAHLMLGGPSAAGTGMHSSRILGDPAAAVTKAEKLHNADHAWIVVVDAVVGRTDPIWVNDMCEALKATAVWAVVDATRKTADTARHLRALGDVEALVVHNVDITSDPATVLGLDVPIVSLDGKPATPHSWAALLCARIAADVVPMAALPRRPARRG